jgi:putative transposase
MSTEKVPASGSVPTRAAESGRAAEGALRPRRAASSGVRARRSATVNAETSAERARRRRRARRAPAGTQLALPSVSDEVKPTVKHGGRRLGAGRKRAAGRRESVEHRVRERHVGRFPVHVTLRRRAGLPSFRHERVLAMVQRVLFDQRRRTRYAASFQIVEFSIQHDHVHLMVEAAGEDGHDALRAGVSGFMIAFARRFNMMLGRRGKVWGDRWHGRELRSPSEVRNILGYIFRNVVKHGTRVYGRGFADHFSSASRFDGWSKPIVRSDTGEIWPTAPPRTWLLETGWRLRGLLDPNVLARPKPKDDPWCSPPALLFPDIP